MSMHLVDRLERGTAESVDVIAAAPWRWLLDLGPDAMQMSISGRRLHAEARALSSLLDIEQPQLHWVTSQGRQTLPLPSSEAAQSIPPPSAVELRRLKMTGRDPASGEEIIYPLVSPEDEQHDYQALIRLIEDNAMPIAGICSRPRLNLRVEERAEVLRRARRMTLRTAPYLARHVEDWEGQSLRMPYPRRLLTALPEDEWSTYENRLVRTVVRDGYTELTRREREVRSVLNQMEQALRVSENQLDELRRGDWPRANRIYELLRGNVSVDALKKRIDELKEQSRRLKRAIAILGSARSSKLFRMLGAVRDERELRPTNLLMHDTAYHSVLVVRQQLNQFMQAQSDQPVEDPLPHYHRWLESALGQSLQQTGFVEARPGQWNGRGWEIEVTSTPSTRLTKLCFQRVGVGDDARNNGETPQNPKISSQGSRKPSSTSLVPRLQFPRPLVIFPVWLDLSVPEHRQRILTEVIASAPDSRYLLLFPGDGSLITTERYRDGGLFPDLAIAASPGRLDSVEILAREIIREVWLRDLLARRWPTWCLVCKNTHLIFESSNKFACDTCHSEAAITQETCHQCGDEFSTPYLHLATAENDASAVSRSYILADNLQKECPVCRGSEDPV